MIKTIVFITKVLVATIVSLLFASCTGNGKHGDGNLRTQTRSVDRNFTRIEVSSAIQVTVEPDSNTSVTVEADGNLLSSIETYVQNGTLYIKAKDSYNTENDVKVNVKMPKVEGLRANSSASIRADKKIISANLDVLSDSAGQIDIETEADHLKVETESGSSVKLSGKALTFAITASSGSEVMAGNLMANDITSAASSGANVEVMPILTLNAHASSGGLIRYTKEPRSKIVSEDSGGSVSR